MKPKCSIMCVGFMEDLSLEIVNPNGSNLF